MSESGGSLLRCAGVARTFGPPAGRVEVLRGLDLEVGQGRIVESTVSDNRANRGGGLTVTDSRFSMDDSTVSGNRVTGVSNSSGGGILATASRSTDDSVICDLDLDMIREVRNTWQFYRDRRPETYGQITAP